ncbi:MAG: ABC transporter, permease protein 2 (cluster 5, nickel/peptides/opines) [uncultured Chloroflexi bacterium]|uniref:ABC transporter, permease protein 2 (Cluster 5, nickel/peptides/opines) n=1 Tax=uncultured Chloroflexota bacterium TaxID=166587 RepID=A0A6J4KIH4_9CHLR|nr:MAG: ABC transporter, permease protein 2 (cluster 5, nickel/peptides/opines) [uncultured Chloroflexota bacterium]
MASEQTVTAAGAPLAVPLAAPGGISEFWYRFSRTRRAVVAALFVVLVVILAVGAPLVTGYDPLSGSADALRPPLSAGHLLGTDHLGRDIWSQLVYGARVSLVVGVLAAASALALGVLVGAVSGYFGGWVDGVLMRLAELFQTLPRFVLALIVVAFFGTGLPKLVAVIAILSWPQTARVVRAGFLSLREAPFVEAARIGGAGSWTIIGSEILPNLAAPIVVTGSLDVAAAILLEAGLGFFGLGDPNLVSWGSMLNAAQQYLRQAWWMSLFPGLAISLVVLAFNVVGDGLNDALNPRLKS